MAKGKKISLCVRIDVWTELQNAGVDVGFWMDGGSARWICMACYIVLVVYFF
jgi:hypothetical protein